jgi:dolichyl-phosphate-mannose-protein mannosyltransferase
VPEPPSPFPVRTPLRPALLLAALFAASTFLVHFLTSLWGMHLGYGYFRDELYFLVCGRHLAWGYVDQPPLVALQARVAEMLFGLSPTGVRIFSFIAHGITIALTGLIAWQLGGRRSSQFLAMSAILAAPVLLGTGNFMSMNSFEPALWMGALLVVLRILESTSPTRAWLLFGLLAGIGIENKHSTVFFLIALFIGLLLSRQRRILFTWSCAAGVAELILVALPNFIWQWANHFPTYEFLSIVAHSDKNIKLPPLAFLIEQVNILLFTTAPLWIGGLIWLAFARAARQWRFIAFTYLLFLAMMMAMHAKNYYVAPIYPVLFAAGSVAFAHLTRREWPLVAYAANFILALCFATGPIVLTILPPERYNAYNAYNTFFAPQRGRSEKFTSPFPQVLSDRFGWPQMVEGFAARYNALPPDIRSHTGIFCGNYGEASAVNILGPAYGLPAAISGHQNYFYWGWNGYTGESMLTLGKEAKDYTDTYAEVVDLGPFDAPWTMDHEHLRYFWLRNRKVPYAQAWPEIKYWY